MSDLLVDNNTFASCAGNQIWGHAYSFNNMHSNIRVTNNHFIDIGRDCVQLAVTSGGVVSGNVGRRIGYTIQSGVSTPAYLAGQYAVFIDTSGTTGVSYTNNSAVSVLGAFFDLDGFAYGDVSGNICRVPFSTDVEYAQDSVASWPGNYTYGIQTANNSFQTGGTNVSITGNTLINCNYGAIRLFSAIGCNISGNIINHPAGSVYPPIMLGNFNPASGGAKTDSYDCSIVNNNIQWNPTTAAACVQEMENWSGSPILWVSGEANWVADNRFFGNCFEFTKATSSSSVTGTVLSSQANGLTATAHATISRQQSGGVNYTLISDAASNPTFKVDDTGASTLSSVAGNAVHNLTAPVGNLRGINMFTDVAGVAKSRWFVSSDASAESGSNAGSNFVISRYDDTGTFIDNPIIIDRKTGILTAGQVAAVSRFFDSFADVQTGTATASGTAITWVSGQVFDTTMVGLNFTFNGLLYSISAFTDSHHITLGSSAGTVSSATAFYIGNAFQTSTGTMQITSGGWGLFQNVVATNVFNSKADIYGGNAFQTSTGTMYITGAGVAGFARTITNEFTLNEVASPGLSSSGTANIYMDSTSHQLLVSVSGGSYVGLGAVAGSNTQVIFNDSGAYAGNAGFLFSKTSKVVTIDSGTWTAGSGFVGNTFTAEAQNGVYGFQLANSNWQVDVSGDSNQIGHRIGPDTYLTNQGSALAGASGYAVLSATSTGLYVSLNGAAATLLRGGVTVPGSNTQVIYNSSGALGASSTFTFGGGVVTSPYFTTSGTTGAFTSTATGANVGYSNNGSGTTFAAIYGNGQIAGQWVAMANQSGAPTAAAGFAFLYPSSTGLFLSLNGGAYNQLATQAYHTAGTGINITLGQISNTGVSSFNGSTGSVTGVSSFNGSTGVITLSSGTGVTVSGGTVSIGQVVSTSSNVQFAQLITSAEANVGYSVTGASYAFQSGGGTANITGAGNAGFQSVATTYDISTSSGIFICQGNSGYTGTVASAAGRNIVGGLVV